MQYCEIPPEIAAVVAIANFTAVGPAGPDAVRRLDFDASGRLPSHDFEALRFDLQTWHPIRDGHDPTVAEVLVQLTDTLRDRVAGVQILYKVAESVSNPTPPTEDNGFITGWALYWIRLYRHQARPVQKRG